MSGHTEEGKVVLSSASDPREKLLHETSSAGIVAWGLALTLDAPFAALAYATGANDATRGLIVFLLLLGLLGLLLLAVGVHLVARKIDDVHKRIVLASPGQSSPQR